jgi:hypothetical protein
MYYKTESLPKVALSKHIISPAIIVTTNWTRFCALRCSFRNVCIWTDIFDFFLNYNDWKSDFFHQLMQFHLF